MHRRTEAAKNKSEPLAADSIARRRLGQQRLTGRLATDAVEVVRWLGAVQAQDFAGAKWALAQRTAGATEAEIGALFDAGKILRTHVLRPTWHFVAPEDLSWMVRLTAPRVKAQMATHDRLLELTPRVFGRSQEVIATALRGGNFLTRAEIGEVLRRRRILASGQRLGHILMRAELDTVVCSGPRRGNQLTYALVEERAPPCREIERGAAVAELARRYFTSHGPADCRDFAWWSGLTLTEAKAGVRAANLHEEKIGGRSLWFDAESPAAAERSAMPVVNLLPSYDEFVVGLSNRTDICGSKIAAKMQATANGVGGLLGNVILIDGQIVGSWRRREVARDGVRLTTAVLRKLTVPEAAALRRAGERYGKFLGRAVSFRQGR